MSAQIYIPGDLYAVGTSNNFGKWSSDIDKFADLGFLGGWKIAQVTWDGQGTMWCVGTEHNVGEWNGTGWNPRKLDDWKILQLVFDAENQMWCVDTENNIGKWDGKGWVNKGKLGGWKILQLVFDAENQMWCVGTENNIGKWDGKGWENQTQMNSRKILQLAFDIENRIWCVDTQNKVGKWNGEGWDDISVFNWKIQWLTWGIIYPSMIDYEKLSRQTNDFAKLLEKPNIMTAFNIDPINTMAANGVNLNFLSDAQLYDLSQLITMEDEQGQRHVLETRSDQACWACWIALLTVFSALGVAVLILTRGKTSLAKNQAVVSATAKVLGVGAQTVSKAFSGIGALTLMSDIATYLCKSAGICQNSSEQ